MSFLVDLPYEMEQQFLAETKDDSQNVIKELVMDYLDKKERQKRREELLNNLDPMITKWAGYFDTGNGSKLTDEDIDQLRYEYLMEKYS